MSQKELIKKLSDNYIEELKEMTSFMKDRDLHLDNPTENDLTNYLLDFNPEGDQENTARESGYLSAMRAIIATVRNFDK